MKQDASLTQGLTDFPLELTTFVGRRSDRGRIRELMSQSRLVTLTGFGGIGKTRLALRVAHDSRRAFESVYLVPFAGLVDPHAVSDHVAGTLGLRGRSSELSIGKVVEYLRSRTILLVLDNCEHVVEEAAVLAETLLRTCPGVHILATSREALRIGAEAEFHVSPLTVPGNVLAEEPLIQYDGVQLFLDRARSRIPDFTLTEDNREDVADIVRKLEGIPLALELAAACLRSSSPRELNGQLTDRWELLGMGNRTAPYRHSTMAACIEWSFDLCGPAERLLWAKASVFVDGFDVEAAVAVCSDPSDDERIVETLAALVEKSVLTVSQHADTTRYRMLPPIRDRGLVELSRMGKDVELACRHKDHFVRLVARAADEWFGPRQLDWIYRLRRETSNIHAALELCAVNPEFADEGLIAGASLLNFGFVEARFQHGRHWFGRILRSQTGDPQVRALALRTASIWAAMQGDFESATSLLDEGQALATRIGGETEALFVHAEGFVALFAGDLRRSETLLGVASQALATFENDAVLAHCLMILALDQLLLGDLDSALATSRASLAIIEPANEIWLRSWSLWIAGLVLWMRGDQTAAKEHAVQSLRLKREIGESFGSATLLETFASFAVADDPRTAANLLGAAQNEWDKIETSTQILPGIDALHRKSTEAARALLGDALFEAAWRMGRHLDRATAIAIALAEEAPPLADETTSTGAKSMLSVLTPREQQTAELIHKGLSNKEIAATFVISPRTAEAHVEHILTKLGFTSRTQIAAWYGDRRGTRNR